MVFFGQVVIGPPGSGKTTYCQGMQMFMHSIGRSCEIINLDFANDSVPYTAAIDVREYLSLEKVMDDLCLGPNGGIVHCMQQLVSDLAWLGEQLDRLSPCYLLIDLPGQVELFTHYAYIQTLLQFLSKHSDCRLCSVHLIDSYYCTDPSVFVSAVLLVASSMMRLALPHISVLTKIDLLPRYGQLPYNLDFFTELYDMNRLVQYIDSEVDHRNDETISHTEPSPQPSTHSSKYAMHKRARKQMTAGLCEVLNDLGLVSFLPLNISDGTTVARVLAAVDAANGYAFVSSEAAHLADAKLSPEQVSDAQRMSAYFKVVGSEVGTVYSRSVEVYERSEQSLLPIGPTNPTT